MNNLQRYDSFYKLTPATNGGWVSAEVAEAEMVKSLARITELEKKMVLLRAIVAKSVHVDELVACRHRTLEWAATQMDNEGYPECAASLRIHATQKEE